VKAGEIRARWRIATDTRRTADEYVVWLRQLLELEGYTTDDVNAVIIGTVVPRATHNLEVLASKYFGTRALIAGQGDALWPIPLEVDEPHNVGADRALNAIAGHAKYKGELVIVDFGTATTFDLVGSNGAYRGGVIAPGLNLSLDALVSAAAKLPRIAIEEPKGNSVIGRTTEDQMLIGVYWGYVSMMEGIIARLKAEVGGKVTVIGTGGLAALFDKRTDVFDAVEPDLTIQGLSRLYEGIAAGE
jgi:type III pantothenate kinase